MYYHTEEDIAKLEVTHIDDNHGTIFDSIKNETVYYLTDSYYERYEERLKNLSSNFSKIKDGDKVYFHKSCLFPKRKFTSYYPNNKISKSVKNADVVVIDNSKRASSYYYYHSSFNYKLSLHKSFADKEVFRVYNTSSAQSILTFMEAMDNNKRMVSINDVVVKSEMELDEETYKMINGLLNSTNPHVDVKLALTMLAGMDYRKYSFEIMNLIRESSYPSLQFIANSSVDSKTLMHKLLQDYPDFMNISYWSRINWLLKIHKLWPGRYKPKSGLSDIEEFIGLISIHVPEIKNYTINIKYEQEDNSNG